MMKSHVVTIGLWRKTESYLQGGGGGEGGGQIQKNKFMQRIEFEKSSSKE